MYFKIEKMLWKYVSLLQSYFLVENNLSQLFLIVVYISSPSFFVIIPTYFGLQRCLCLWLCPTCYVCSSLSYIVSVSVKLKAQLWNEYCRLINSEPVRNVTRLTTNLLAGGRDPNGCMMSSSNGNIFRVIDRPLCGEFAGHHRPVTRSFDVFFDLRMKKRLSKQSRRRWFKTPSCSSWRHCNGMLARW